MVKRGVVTFLESRESLEGVDEWFRRIVELLYQIPFCASWGVSCSGHFGVYEKQVSIEGEAKQEVFFGQPFGHLDIIIEPSMSHINELKEIIKRIVKNESNAGFWKKKHHFRPPTESSLEIWEISIGDNNCMQPFSEFNYYDEYPVAGNEEIYGALKRRCDEVKSFWKTIEKEIRKFCRKHGFEEFDLDARVAEINSKWR